MIGFITPSTERMADIARRYHRRGLNVTITRIDGGWKIVATG